MGDGVDRIDSEGWPNDAMPRGQLERFAIGLRVQAIFENDPKTSVPSALNHRIAIGVELLVVQMRVDIDQP